MQQWDYRDQMVVYAETEEGLISGLENWINDWGRDGWELVAGNPLIAPNAQGAAYGTVGVHLIFKRPAAKSRKSKK
ncbi:MAG: DUF4177 domain-containing protein [Chloroflexi bacterium]|nr:DUF4177 domain-containing protein [Chloroflexota bacterium]